ncbi:hypothetical protein [Rheinheimera fenheensis]|uniref:hypothetical protein n=1 Tax=Rheinheimera fenheensis TaxID=3152295 RepID=UPI003260A036
MAALDSQGQYVQNAANDLDQIAFQFFREFSRCEYCLKAIGLLEPNRRDPTADWGAFAQEVSQVLAEPESGELRTAVEYFLAHPPKKQVIKNGLLSWSETLPDHKSQAELVLRLICRTRNNLFHGGKFNGHWFEPQRSMELLVHALTILSACISNHKKAKDAYEQKAV